MAEDPDVFLMGQDIAAFGGAFKVTRGLVEEFGEDRVLNTPIAEAGMIGIAAGAALLGRRPVVEMQFSDFVSCGFNPLVNVAAKFYYRTGFKVPLVIRLPSGGGVGAGPFHSQSLEATFLHVPGLKVVAPAWPEDAYLLLREAVRDPNPVLFFEDKLSYNTVHGVVPQGDYVVPIGKANIQRDGTQLSLISYGLSMFHCLEAAKTLSSEGISCEVVDLRTVKPLDLTTILESVRKTGRACIVHEDNLTGGIGAEVAAIIAKDGFDYLDAPVHRVASADVPSFPYSPGLEDALLPGPADILRAARELCAY